VRATSWPEVLAGPFSAIPYGLKDIPSENMSGIPQRRLFLSPPHLGRDELQFVQEAFASNYIAPLGPMVDAFEREFAACSGIPHCLALSSGTAAMHLALRELGVRPGDEVIASTLTFIGSVSPAAFLGASPVFIDSDRKTWNMDPELLAEELAECAKRGQLPKAVVPTDLYGQCADLERISALCAPYGIPVVADSAEAVGSRYRVPEDGRRKIGDRSAQSPISDLLSPARWAHAGRGAKAAVYSFNGNKIITTSGGGMLASEDEQLIAHARKLSQQARDPAPHYEHSEIGYNYRMSNVVAAIGRGQLRTLTERVERKRHHNCPDISPTASTA
jgi:dTDP-4-amino-4,6-dideoxygalactose transaminase